MLPLRPRATAATGWRCCLRVLRWLLFFRALLIIIIIVIISRLRSPHPPAEGDGSIGPAGGAGRPGGGAGRSRREGGSGRVDWGSEKATRVDIYMARVQFKKSAPST
jgi:hypothetical protein